MERLCRRRDLDRVFREGRRFPAPWVVLQVRARGREEGVPALLRVAVVPGRGFPNAVSRNRARRVVREACRAATRAVKGAWDLVLVVRPEAAEVPHPERVRVVSELLRRAGVLGEEMTTTP